MSSLERASPSDIEAEQYVLGAMMLGNKNAVATAGEILTERDFYRGANAKIFSATCRLADRDDPIDIVTLRNELGSDIEEVGGLAYLMHLADFVPTTANIAYHAEIVKDKAIKRRCIEAASLIAGLAYSDDHTAADVTEFAEKSVYGLMDGRSTAGFTPLREAISTEYEEIDTRHQAAVTAEEEGREVPTLTGLTTGFAELNQMTGGLHAGELTILAARPSMGKSGLAFQEALSSAKAGAKVALVSLEMPKRDVVRRYLASDSRVDLKKIRNGQLSETDWTKLSETVHELWDLPIWIDDTPGLSAVQIRSRVRQLAARVGGIDVVVIDYMQLCADPQGSGTKNDALTETVKTIKNIAREMDCAVIALSQLSRAVERREDKRPVPSDLRDSGSLEAEADNIRFIYRPAYYERKGDATETPRIPGIPEEAEIIIAKQRNGPTGTVKLAFFPELVRFDNLERYRADQPQTGANSPF